MNAPTLWDSVEQEQELTRVTARIGKSILEFCADRAYQEFHMHDLEAHVLASVPVAPGSPCRVFRDLRRKGLVNYEVVNRSQSLYRLLPLDGAQ